MQCPQRFELELSKEPEIFLRIAVGGVDTIMVSPDREDTTMKKQELTITPALIQKYALYLREQERAVATIEKYVHDLTSLSAFLAGLGFV